MGLDMKTAVGKAKEYVFNAINAAKGLDTGHGHGSLNHLFAPEKLKVR